MKFIKSMRLALPRAKYIAYNYMKNNMTSRKIYKLGMSRLIDSNRIESIQVVNRLIDSKRLSRFTETIHYFYLFNALLPENTNKLIFI